MARYTNSAPVEHDHLTVSISGPPALAMAAWEALTEKGITVDGTEGIKPSYITDGNFSDDRRGERGNIGVRYAKLIYHTEK